MFLVVGDGVIKDALDGVENLVPGNVIGNHTAERLKRGVHVAFYEAQVDRGADGVDGPVRGVQGDNAGIGPDLDDASAGYSDGAVFDEPARVIRRNDVGVPDGVIHVTEGHLIEFANYPCDRSVGSAQTPAADDVQRRKTAIPTSNPAASSSRRSAQTTLSPVTAPIRTRLPR